MQQQHSSNSTNAGSHLWPADIPLEVIKQLVLVHHGVEWTVVVQAAARGLAQGAERGNVCVGLRQHKQVNAHLQSTNTQRVTCTPCAYTPGLKVAATCYQRTLQPGQHVSSHLSLLTL